jgi:hypothetical protein
LSTANFLASGLSPGSEARKQVAGNYSTGLFPELTLKELVFLCHKYYAIFLLQQEAIVPREIQL